MKKKRKALRLSPFAPPIIAAVLALAAQVVFVAVSFGPHWITRSTYWPICLIAAVAVLVSRLGAARIATASVLLLLAFIFAAYCTPLGPVLAAIGQ